MSIAFAPLPVATRRTVPTLASLSAAVLLVAIGVIAAIAPEQLDDHSTGVGRLSEALAGFAFIAGAIALATLLPRGTLVRVLWLLAVVGLAGMGLTMLSVVPIMFLVPFNSFFMAAIWILVAW